MRQVADGIKIHLAKDGDGFHGSGLAQDLSSRYDGAMTRRFLLASLATAALPSLSSLDLLKVTTTYGGRTFVRYEPRAVMEARLRRIRAWKKQMGFRSTCRG